MIHVKDLYKSYGKQQVLKGLNLDVQAGETVVILGQSGCGKSVLLRQIMGLERADRGFIEVDGINIAHLRGHKLYEALKHVGMLFQAGALFDSLTVSQNIGFFLREHTQLSKKEIKARVNEALAMVGLEGVQKAMPSDLSGGMRKRAALARLIAYRPSVLLYDEPTTGLDPITAMQINDLILQTQQELNSTSIVVTHDLCSAFHIADRVALNVDGKIPYITTKEEFIKIEDPLVESFLKSATPEEGVWRR